MLKVAVGSLNPVKIAAVKSAFTAMLGECEVACLAVASGISNMPMSFAEIIKGAKNRALAALQATEADYGVGLEGGLNNNELGYFLMGFVAIVDKAGTWGYAGGEGLYMPDKIFRMVKESGKELGEVMDDLRGVKNSKQHEGVIGYFTDNLIDREESFRNPTICALSRFKKSELFE